MMSSQGLDKINWKPIVSSVQSRVNILQLTSDSLVIENHQELLISNAVALIGPVRGKDNIRISRSMQKLKQFRISDSFLIQVSINATEKQNHCSNSLTMRKSASQERNINNVYHPIYLLTHEFHSDNGILPLRNFAEMKDLYKLISLDRILTTNNRIRYLMY